MLLLQRTDLTKYYQWFEINWSGSMYNDVCLCHVRRKLINNWQPLLAQSTNHAISLPTTVYWGNNLPISSDNEPGNHFMTIKSVFQHLFACSATTLPFTMHLEPFGTAKAFSTWTTTRLLSFNQLTKVKCSQHCVYHLHADTTPLYDTFYMPRIKIWKPENHSTFENLN